MDKTVLQNIENFKNLINQRLQKLEDLIHSSKSLEQRELSIYKKQIESELQKELNKLKEDFNLKIDLKIKEFESKYNKIKEDIELNTEKLSKIDNISIEILNKNKDINERVKALEDKLLKIETYLNDLFN